MSRPFRIFSCLLLFSTSVAKAGRLAVFPLGVAPSGARGRATFARVATEIGSISTRLPQQRFEFASEHPQVNHALERIAFKPLKGAPEETLIRARACDDLIGTASSSTKTISLRRSLLLTGSLLVAPEAAKAEEAMGNVGQIFVGQYTDPNHPGGYRKVTLLDSYQGELREARVEGGRGRGEPSFFELFALVGRGPNESGALVDYIIINFAPKGGPSDFLGIWDKDGITFLGDGNHWPKQKPKKV